MARTLARREFLALVPAIVASARGQGTAVKPVRVGVVGTGNRGGLLLRILLALPGVEVPAICDIDEAAIARARQTVEKAGRAQPEAYTRGPEDYRRLVERPDLDAVINATPWPVHVPVSLAAMNAGKYVGTEVPAALTIEDCWRLVKTSERARVPCMMLENVNYFRNVMLILNMVQQGVFGEVIHCAGGYQHDIRALKFERNGELKWRGRFAETHNGNLYPTHPIGPIARWMNINHGDRFTSLVSMSTVSHGMNHYAERKFGPNHPSAKLRFAESDVSSTLIQTAKGYTVALGYETQATRPYDLGFRVQGTKGIYSGTLDKIWIETADPDAPETWADLKPYYDQYEHPMWKEMRANEEKYGHGGGDYLVVREFIKAVRERTQTPIDVYDTVTWSAIVALTSKSLAKKSAPVEFPDFTSGRWKTAKPVQS